MHKKICSLIIAMVITTILSAQSDDKVLMTVGDIPVTVGEFKYIYEKNNGDNADYSKASVHEYLDLYKKFKLKVAKAKDLKLDTIQALKDELKGYRHQLASSYMTEKHVLDDLLKSAYKRKQKDIEVAHIFFAKDNRMGEGQIDEIRQKAEEVRALLKKGLSWEEAVETYSQDKYSKEKDGIMGFLNAPLPKGFFALEEEVYNLPVGKIGDVIETKIGFHIPKVISVRDARGTIKVAQIYIKSDVKGSVENGNNKNLAESAYQELKKGAKWEDVLQKYASEGNSKKLNGEMDEFGIGVYEKDFENAAFGLKKDGDISKPVETRLGFHILKRIYKGKAPSYEDFDKTFRASFQKRDRFKVAEERMIEGYMKDAGVKVNDKVLNDFASSVDDNFFSFKWKPDPFQKNADLLQIGSYKYDLMDFIGFIKKNTRLRSQLGKGYDPRRGVQRLFEEFKKDKALFYAEEKLEQENNDFKSLMREYNEGVLLFEITKNKVWDKASADTVGLRKYYDAHKADYTWKDRATVQKYSLLNAKGVRVSEVLRFAENNPPKDVMAKYNKLNNIVRVQEVKHEKDHESFNNMDFRIGASSPVTAKSNSNVTEFMVITDIEKARPKTLDEARGYVIADYQEQLEKEWIETLKKEYKIDVKKRVLKSLIRK